MSSNLDLGAFFPEYLKIIQIKDYENHVRILLVSETKSANCPVCGCESTSSRTSYWRRVSDLPILGKPVTLEIYIQEYNCTNKDCSEKTFREQLPGFLGAKMMKTKRCQDFILSLASEMSCEAASKFCKQIGVKISGDTIIRMLLRNTHEIPFIGDIIGVDDWAYRKGQSYGTLICNGKTHKPIALLPGRDGKSFREWLQNNPQIKTVTRDRASAYSSVINDLIPCATQIADKFHLFENLLDAVKEIVKALLPERVGVKLLENSNADECKSAVTDKEPDAIALEACAASYDEPQNTPVLSVFEEESQLLDPETPQSDHEVSLYEEIAIAEEAEIYTPGACASDEGPLAMQPLSNIEENNRLLILEVRRLYNEVLLSNTEIKNKLGMSYRRVKKYLSGDINELCRDGRHVAAARPSKLEQYHAVIQDMLTQRKTRKEIFNYLASIGYGGAYSRLADYCAKNFGGSKNITKSKQATYDGDHVISKVTEEAETLASETIVKEEESQEDVSVINATVEEPSMLLPLSKHEEDNHLLILEIQRLSREECLSNTEIKKKVGISYRRIKRYLSGEADELCRDGRHGAARSSKLDQYYKVIKDMLAQRKTRKEIYHYLTSIGYTGVYSMVSAYCIKHFKNNKKTAESSVSSEGCDHFISRKSVFNHVWSDQSLDQGDKDYIFNEHPELINLKEIVIDFQKAMETKEEPRMKQWIDKIIQSGFSALQSLGNGMKQDLEAVLNSIRFNENNGFLEGNVNRLKAIKRSMFGRAKFPLLKAKILRLCDYF